MHKNKYLEKLTYLDLYFIRLKKSLKIERLLRKKKISITLFSASKGAHLITHVYNCVI
jgi:hypothetical protein